MITPKEMDLLMERGENRMQFQIILRVKACKNPQTIVIL